MAKTNANFNMSRVTKYKLAGYTDPVARNFYKKMMIDAELTAEHASRMAAKSKGKKNDS